MYIAINQAGRCSEFNIASLLGVSTGKNVLLGWNHAEAIPETMPDKCANALCFLRQWYHVDDR